MSAIADVEVESADQPQLAPNGAPLVTYKPNDAAIAKLKDEFAGLAETANTPDGFRACHQAQMTLTRHRMAVEKQRVKLKADSLAWGRRVDAEAKRLTALIEEVEAPIRTAVKSVRDEEARVKREAEEAEAARLAKAEQDRKDAEEADRLAKWQAKEKELADARAAQEAEQAEFRRQREIYEAQQKADADKRAAAAKAEYERQQAIMKAEREEAAKRQAEAEAKLREERKAEDERRLAERRRADAEFAVIKEAQRKEQAKIDAERRKVEDEKAALERERLAKEAAARAEKEARERVERERIAAEERARVDAEAAAEAARLAEAERLRLEAIKPDRDKIWLFGKQLLGLDWPELTTDEAAAFMRDAKTNIDVLARQCGFFGANVVGNVGSCEFCPKDGGGCTVCGAQAQPH